MALVSPSPSSVEPSLGESEAPNRTEGTETLLPEPEPVNGRRSARFWVGRGFALGLIAGLLGFIGWQGVNLYREWTHLQRERFGSRNSVVIGYVGLNPRPSYARHPGDWFRHEGEATLVWGGWRPGVGHEWFRFGRGEIAREGMTDPLGRDVIQAIDYPLVEVGGGPRWGRLPEEARVFGLEMDGVAAVYPWKVLAKVYVVNDTLGGRPLLVAISPHDPEERSVAAYEPVVDGIRLTMGLSGYYRHGKPVLYDRGTESFWSEQDGALTAFAGKHRGSRLRRTHQLTPLAWSEWVARYPASRLLIGADRSQPIPTL